MKKGNAGGLQRDNAAAMKKKSLFRMVKPYLFLLPIYLLMVTFKYIPFGMAIIKSFFNWNGANVNLFVGLDNYIAAFRDIKSTKKQYVVRTAFTFPMVVPSVVIILLWKWILAGDTGVLNNILTSVGLGNLAKPWLGDSRTALGSIIAIGFPWLGSASLGGLQFFLYFGALQNISKDMFEATEIYGANIFQRFIKIDLPMLASQMKLTVTLAIINAVQVFDTVYILTKGGPGTATITPSVVLYEQGFTYRKMGYASAIGVIMFAIIMVLTVINQKLMKNTESMD